MKTFSILFPIALVCSLLGFGTPPHSKSVPGESVQPKSAQPKSVQPSPADTVTLESVLKRMDETAAAFRTTQADFEWDHYERVIDEVDNFETGVVYYRRNGKDVEMKADVKMTGSTLKQMQAQPKYVLFKDGKIQVYDPKGDQVTVWDLGKNAQDFESYLVLGFGGSGQDLLKAFSVTFGGTETINGVATAKLELVPKSDRVRNNFNQILLWVDLEKGISIQQKFINPQGDYRLTKYSSVQVNEKKIPDDVFKLKTTGKTQTVSPRG